MSSPFLFLLLKSSHLSVCLSNFTLTENYMSSRMGLHLSLYLWSFLPPHFKLLSPIWLMFCLHLFRCSQQQWPSSRLVCPRCQVSFCILPAIHSILQLSSLRSRGGKSAVRRRTREGEEEEEEEGRNKIIVHPVTDWSGSSSRHPNDSRQLVTSD